MPRETSPYIVGDYWLDKRRDGKSPVWQIASYDTTSRQVRYRSTRRAGLDDARAVLDAFFSAEKAKRPQSPDEAKVIPLLFLYWEEHGRQTIRPDTIAGSIRAFIGFLLQDEASADVTVAQLNPTLFERFRQWRMAPHSYDVPWQDRVIRHASKGVRGESVQRNLDDIRAALNHQANNGRIPYAPKVPVVAGRYRSAPRDRVLSRDELGAVFGAAAHDIDMFRFLATAVRTEAALKCQPVAQYQPARGLIDLHPVGAPRTKKHNPVVPVIPEFAIILDAWAKSSSPLVASRKKRWRTLRRTIGLGLEVEPKTIRHTVATRLRGLGVPPQQVESLLGHRIYRGSSAVYAKYDPNFLGDAKCALSTIFADTMLAALEWSAVHSLSKEGNSPRKVVARNIAEE